jgi:cyclopropane-fatty-acyl-phospholipid synthase
VAKPAVLAVLARIEKGTLLLVDEPAEARHVFGQKLGAKAQEALDHNVPVPRRADTVPRVELVVKSDAFWMRLFLFADMGFAEAFMLGEVECRDPTAFFQVSSPLDMLHRGNCC